MPVEEFRDHHDQGYLRWVADHPRGYVINIQQSHNPRDARLHAARCDTITGTPARGDTFTGEWVKICSESLAELDSWSLQQADGLIKRCGICHPL
jgi:hypothetical protein